MERMPGVAAADFLTHRQHTGTPMLTSNTFPCFAELEANNNKTWFDAHRTEFETLAVRPLTAALEAATAALASTPMPLIGGKHTLFRINRDIRFSANKAPYKTQVSGLLTPDGSKLADEGVAYLQLDQHGGHMSAGYYNLTPDVLERIRSRIVATPEVFRAVLDDLSAAGMQLTDELALTGMPRAYARYASQWYAPYLKMRVYLVRTRLTRDAWMDGTVVPRLVDQTITCASLIRFGQST
jgi:uncharacterized protein (TIGR02453 family)